jgi:amino acid adenylation domain-containing protein
MPIQTDVEDRKSQVAARRTALSGAKQSKLEQLLRKRAGEDQVRLIPARPHDGAVALSFAQERLWFLDQLEPNRAIYNIPVVLRATGALTIVALEQGLNEIVRRHEALRTSFAGEDGVVTATIHSAAPVDLRIVDLAYMPEGEREREAQRLVEEEIRRPFDLARGGLLRFTLLKTDAHRHILALTTHHIVSDAWSFQLFVDEIGSLYRAFCCGQPSALPDLPIQYADYAVWQRQRLSGEILERDLSYWKQRLKDPPPILDLPLDRPRPAVMSYKGETFNLRIQGGLLDELRAVNQREGQTLFISLLASFQALLSLYSGQEDIVVGTPVAGRDWEETENLIGLFVNTLVMRAKFFDALTVREFLAQVRETLLDAHAHQHVPFEKVVEELRPERSLSHAPLFQVMFVLKNVARKTLDLDRINLSAVDFDPGVERFDLTLSVTEDGRELDCSIGYSTDLFDRSTAERMAGHWQQVLRAMAGDLERRVSSISLLTESERRHVVTEWNQTALQFAGPYVHEFIEESALRTPEAVAVIYEQEELTYAQLNRQANQLAHYLKDLGVGPESLVAVCMERSLDLVVALLASLKTGAAYVPLDPAYPAGRLAFMMSDARPPVLVTQQHLLQILPPHSASTVVIDSGREKISRQSGGNLRVRVEPENLAYVIYTSGSTGQPKGAMNTHAGLRNRLLWMQAAYRLLPEDSVLQKTPFSFDVSVWEFFWPLMAGAKLVVARPGGHQDPAYLASIIATRLITTVHFVPSMLKAFLASGVADQTRGLRRIICSGEALPVEVARQCMELIPAELHNLYGPTEASIDVTYWKCDPADLNRVVQIGKPIANTQTYVLNANMEPAPPGVAGELYLGGAGLGRGYLHRSELTGERFVPSPLGPQGGARLYRTGDWARWRAGGNLEFLGRRDEQIKLRGNRIELGEIEAALRQHSQLKDAAVAVRSGRGGEQRLVAYIVARDARPPANADLRKYLQERLAEYMVPDSFMTLEALPISPAGKLDRRALPAPPAATSGEAAFVAPRTLVEEMLAGIWMEVLGLEKVGKTDNFFLLGGHSLIAIRVIARLRNIFKVELPVRSMFESPTLAGLAERIEAAVAANAGRRVTPIQARSNERIRALSYAQQRLWFLDQLKPGGNTYNIPGAVALEGHLNVAALEQALSEIVRRHEALRSTFMNAGGHPRQLISQHVPLNLPLVDLTRLSQDLRSAVARRLAGEEALRPFDLTRGPLFRAYLVRLGERQHTELFTLHHIVSDGWSMNVLTEEAEYLYREFSHCAPSQLPDLEIQYGDYAEWQREWLQGEVLQRELDYWKGHLADAPTVLEIATDKPRPAVRTLPGEQCPIGISESLATALGHLGRGQGATVFMTLMAAFQVLLWRLTGQEKILVGTPIAGRDQVETEKLIGFFVNMVVIRADIRGALTFTDFLAQIRESSLEAYAHQNLPFDKLVEELKPARSLDRNPLFQVVLAFQNGPAPGTGATGVASPLGGQGSANTKFDLEVYFWQGKQGIHGSLVYSPELFEDTTMRRLADRFVTLLEAIVQRPAVALAGLELVGPAELHQVLEEWNQTDVEFERESCIHELFERQVRQQPDAVAIDCEDEQITYQELNHRANILANYLRKQGVGPEVFVGLLLDRSAEMVVALLGILKAGGAYVPINTADPGRRIEFILKDAAISILITSRQIQEKLPASQLKVICLDSSADREALLTGGSAARAESGAVAGNLAYLIYTSGSTGTPKGVCVSHRSVLRLVRGANYAELTPSEVFLLFAPVSFDASTFEIWGCLLNGARLALFPPGVPSLKELGDYIDRRQITTLWLTSGLFHQMVDGNLQGLSTIKQLLAGGEVMSRKHADKVLEEIRGCHLIHGYGPTETTTFATTFRVGKAHMGSTVPIGKPISNTTILLLNRALRPAGIGERAEIFIGGEGVARGYFNRPDLTAERFLPDPFGRAKGARVYMTGDLARYLNTGDIEFIGRADTQIKLRGFRIELGEIEAALQQCAGIRQAVVIVREDTSGDRRLVAYVVADRKSAPASESLKADLRERLPDYMVPSVCVTLEELPLTPNGKVDKAALPAPDRSLIRSEKSFVAAKDKLQEQLVVMWEELLGIHPIGIQDDFFELGGHSLLAVQLISRIEERLGQRVPMASLFQEATIEHLSSLLRDETSNASDSSVIVPIQPDGSGPAMFCVHAAGGTVFCYADLSRHLGSGQPLYGVQSRTVSDKEALPHLQLEAMAAEYVAALRAFQPAGPYYIGGWSMGGVIAFEMARQLIEQQQKVALLALIDPEAPSGKSVEYKWVVLLGSFATDLGIPLEMLRASWDAIFTLPPMQQLNKVWAEARKLKLVPPDMTLADFRKLFDAFKTNAQMMRNYPGGPYAGRITLFRAEKPVEYIGKYAPDDYRTDTDLSKGWEKWAAGGVDIHTVSGQHYTMMKEPHVKNLADELNICIQNAARNSK